MLTSDSCSLAHFLTALSAGLSVLDPTSSVDQTSRVEMTTKKHFHSDHSLTFRSYTDKDACVVNFEFLSPLFIASELNS